MQPTEPLSPTPTPTPEPTPMPSAIPATAPAPAPVPQPSAPLTPTPVGAPVENLTQSPQPPAPESFSNTPPSPYQPAPPIAQQWQTSQEYAAAQVTAQAPRAGSGIPQKAAIALGISVFIFILASTTPLGDLGSFSEEGSRAMTARPIAGIAGIGALVSYFVMVISGIVTSKSTGKTLSIIGLVIGAILVANPIGIIMLFLLIGCNFTACQGS